MAERVFLKLWIIEFEGTIYMILYWSQVGLRTQEGQSNTLPHSKTSRYPILSTLFHSIWTGNKICRICSADQFLHLRHHV